jgi:hypothetical protein
VSVSDQITQAILNGADFVPLTDHRSYDQHYDPLWESSSALLVRGEEANGAPHAIVLGAVDTIVQGANSPGQPDFQRMQWSIWDAHAQDANWDTAHPDDGETNADGSPNIDASAQGVDNIEVWNRASMPDVEIDYAETRWNLGFRTGVTGASDDHFRETWVLQGPLFPTTEVFAPNLSERGLVQGLRLGHTRIHAKDSAGPVGTTGPDLLLEADMQLDGIYELVNGDEVAVPAGTKGQLRITIANGLGTSVYLYKSPGRSAGPLQTFTPTGVTSADVFTVPITADSGPSWYRLEARGPGESSAIDLSALEAFAENPTSPLPTSLELSNQLRGVSAPIFLGPALIDASPETPLPVDAGTDDGAKLITGAQGLFSGFPDIAVANGRSHVVSELHANGSSQVMYQALDATGTAIGSSVNLAPTSTTARFPKVAASGNDVWVVWQDERAGEVPHRPAIYLRHSTNGGTSWQAEQLVRSLGGRAEHPVVAVTVTGLPVVAWQEISAGNAFDVMAQIIGKESAPINLSGSGKTTAAANAVDSRSARYPASVWPTVAVAPDGHIAVGWQDNRTDEDPLWTGGISYGNGTDPDNWQIMVAVRAPTATTWQTPSSIGSDTQADRHPSIAYGADGSVVAAWDSKPLSSSGANLVVLSARSVDGGSTWNAPAAISTSAVGMGEFPHLGVDSNGQVRVVWHDCRSADWRWRIMTSSLDGGGIWSAASLIPSHGVNTWAATQAGQIVWASTRNAQRIQRDPTQQIMLLSAP